MTEPTVRLGVLSPATPNRPHFKSFESILPRGISIAHNGLGLLGESYQDLAGKSPAFQKAFGAKVRRYGCLLDVVKRLSEERKLAFRPTFLCPIVSSLGYINEDMTKLMKFMVLLQGKLQQKESRLDGLALKELKGRYKVELKNTLCFALVRANALSLCNQGVNGITHPT